MIYTLTPEEMLKLRNLSIKIIDTMTSASVARYYMDGRADGEARITRNVEGYMAEFAVAKHLEVPFMDYSIDQSGNDGNVDLVKDGWKIGVKSTRHKNGGLPIKQAELRKPVVPDIYMLCIVDVSARVVDIKGYAITKHITTLKKLRPDTEPVYFVEQKHLRKLLYGART